MKPENFKKQAWIGIGIVAASVIVFGAAFYVLTGDIQKQVDAIAGYRSDIANQSALIDSYGNLKANVASATAYQAAMDKLLGTQDNLIAFPSQIDSIARSDGVDAKFSFESNPVPAGPNMAGYVGFDLNATGPLSSISTFLEDIESSTPILLSKIDTFDLSQSGQTYTIATKGRVFFK